MRLQPYSNLNTLLLTHVCEIYFLRRHPITGKSDYRRMLCTNSLDILNSFSGRTTLLYRRPYRPPQFTDAERQRRGLIIVWDIIMQDYRYISMDLCGLVKQYKVITEYDKDKFWKLFGSKFYIMDSLTKEAWMDS